jgi:hypothetical protein
MLQPPNVGCSLEMTMAHVLLRSTAAAAMVPMLALALAAPAQAQADGVRITASGVFTAETPTLSFSAPGAAWSLSFVVDRNPIPMTDNGLTLVGSFFTTSIREFRMLVNGVETEQASLVSFYSQPNDGGMDVFFGAVNPGVSNYYSLGALGDAYYSGSELAPTMLAGQYPTFSPGQSGMYVVALEDKYWQPATTITISPVPTPTALAMMLGGLALLALRRHGPRGHR